MVERRGRGWLAAGHTPVVAIPGDLLVASVLLQGDSFDQSVVLVLDATEAGTTGIVLNRSAVNTVDEVLPGWGRFAMAEAGVCCGGPVSRDGALGLARLADPHDDPAGWVRCFGDVGLVALDTPAAEVAGRYRDLRIFVGHAGWGPGQLRGEIEAGLWYVLPGRPGDAFTPDPDGLWRRVLRRVPSELSYLSTWPADAARN